MNEADRRRGFEANDEKTGTSTSSLFAGAALPRGVLNLNSFTTVGADRWMRGTPRSPADSITRLLSGRALKGGRW